ncbi:endonuclease domain-containing protein [Adlercreutzia aquisgranensis]|uniref:endonuclease domain-containing protein n=1 Tax=Adlercreutzia aquisgranensis TaxID=2941323 RepID=UPI0020424BA6|nr:endonuclease domain-containing protein [Adlercreutzia aquisgranensis]
METTLALLLCLPKQKGGMGLPKPEMNARITIPPNLRRLAKRGYVRADLLWRRQKVLVEYDSDWAHANTRSLNADAAKRNVLQRMGYTVITLTKDQVNEWGAFWEFASIVSHALRRGQGRDLGDWTNQQVRLWASRGCGTDCPELPFSADDAPSPRLPQPSLLQEPAQSAGS